MSATSHKVSGSSEPSLREDDAAELRELPADGEMGLLEHLAELRRCLLISALAILVGATVAYSYSSWLFELLARPFKTAFPDALLIGTGPAEAFMIRIKVSAFAGVVMAMPVMLMQLWRFISPGLYAHERKLAVPFVLVSSALFGAGVCFCYQILLPVAFQFFSEQYVEIGISPTIRISEHLSMMVTCLVSLGVTFETPVVAFVLGRLGVISHTTLISGFRYAVVGIFIVAAIATPPDVISQFLLAGPLLLLYAISILIVRYTAGGRSNGE